MKRKKENKEEDVEESKKCEMMSHSEGVKAVKEALCYFKHQGAPAVNIQFLHQVHDEAPKRRNQSEKQKSPVFSWK